jgi:hypothetical protein
VPGFLRSEQWAYERPLRSLRDRPAGFDGRGASAGVRFNGFYLFQTTVTRTANKRPADLAA